MNEMLLWCGDPCSVPPHPNAWCWDGTTRSSAAKSLLDYIEAHADQFRKRYLRWVEDLGNVSIAERCLRDRFATSAYPSLWANSIFVEQSRWKQPSLEIILRLFAVGEILDAELPRSFVVVGSSRRVKVVLERMCLRRGVCFEASGAATPHARVRLEVKSLVKRLPHIMQGALALAYLSVTRLSLRPRRKALSAVTVGEF